MTLDELSPGERAVVTGWSESGPPHRILEMGVLEGTELELIRVAPLGDPLEFRLRGYFLSIRKEDAAHILVEPKR